MSSAPNDTRKGHIDTLVGALKTAGVWTKMDAFVVLAAHDAQAASLNWVDASNYDVSLVAAPTFAADRGYTGNGSSSYISTQFNAATAVSPKFVQNSAHYMFWSRTTTGSSNVDMGVTNAAISCRNATDLFPHRVNTGTGYTIAGNTDGSGCFITSRTGALTANNFGQRNGVTGTSSGGAVSNAVNNEVVRVLGRAGTVSFSARQCAAYSIGSGLTEAEGAALYTALQTYMTAVGA